jgi:aspartyl-tRNA(Asn)/glutamyl-tRNA(Gln) amidotransferase subunit C
MAIELKDVEHLAGLARIAVSDSEKEVLRKDLEDILAYVSQVTAVTAEMGAPEAGELHNVMREDEGAHEAGIFTEDILSQAPAREGNLLSVKKIL